MFAECQKLLRMHNDVGIGRCICNGSDTRVVREGTSEHSEKRPPSLPLSHEPFSHNVALLKRCFTILDAESGDATVSIKRDGFGTVEIVIAVIVRVLHHLLD